LKGEKAPREDATIDRSVKVLVVDDFTPMRRIIKRALKQIGFTKIIEAEDGSEALREVKREDIGLILSNWNMPKMTGIDLLKAVRGNQNFRAIPFIMVTAVEEKPKVLETVQAGVSNYIIKPFTREVLEEKIRKVLS
jgi:two-component system chemotaxis response regulator CheY